jgi:stalled ribosome alternative rescue factor ArfA
MSEIKWELTGTDKNDLKAVVGDYMLRVERMSKGKWWYNGYFKSEPLTHDYLTESSMFFAKLKCEQLFNEHKLKQCKN